MASCINLCINLVTSGNYTYIVKRWPAETYTCYMNGVQAIIALWILKLSRNKSNQMKRENLTVKPQCVAAV